MRQTKQFENPINHGKRLTLNPMKRANSQHCCVSCDIVMNTS